MAISFAKTSYAGHFPEIWRGECKILPGGFKPAQTFAAGTVLHRGLPVYVDFDARTAAVCKAAKVIDGGTTSKIRIAKGNCFAVGDKVSNVGGSVQTTISSIDTTNADYDIINVASAITGIAADSVLVESSAAGTAAYTPNAVLGAVKEFDGKGIDALDVAYEAVVLIPSVAYTIPSTWTETGSPCLKTNPNILFITQ